MDRFGSVRFGSVPVAPRLHQLGRWTRQPHCQSPRPYAPGRFAVRFARRFGSLWSAISCNSVDFFFPPVRFHSVRFGSVPFDSSLLSPLRGLLVKSLPWKYLLDGACRLSLIQRILGSTKCSIVLLQQVFLEQLRELAFLQLIHRPPKGVGSEGFETQRRAFTVSSY